MGKPEKARQVTVAATQMACDVDIDKNLRKAETLVRKAHEQGAQIILIQELFASPYFCKDQDPKYFSLAETVDDSRVIKKMRALAAELEVVLPVSFFEKANRAYFNSLVVIDADGSIVSHYRKSHIPDGPGYQEKFYFSPGDTGFRVADTRYANIGVAICWDQWFPEAARSMVLMGADLLFYPTAIGSEPVTREDSRDHWCRVMQGHSAANMVPVIASNRIGVESGDSCELAFYGSSFITDETGGIVSQASRDSEEIILSTFDIDQIAEARANWGLFRDRRPDLYDPVVSLGG
ncbi:MAG: N-carbamoylputrescine amidase [Woeseiaceae bacterium]